MDPRELVRRLIDDVGETPNSIVLKTRPKMTQSTLHRFLTSGTGETRRSSLKPLADYFRVPVDAFYDPQVAQEIAASRGIQTSHLAPPPDPSVDIADSQSPTIILAKLAALLKQVPADSRGPIGALLDRWAQDGGTPSYQAALEALFKNVNPTKN